MKRFDILLIFFAFVLSSTVLFQNCSGMEAGIQDTTANGSGNEILPPAPQFLANRDLALDNLVTSGTVNFGIFEPNDTYYYETDYAGTYKSSLVSMYAQGPNILMVVDADNCNNQKTLTVLETDDFTSIMNRAFDNAQIRVVGATETVSQGCSFPRLVLNGSGAKDDWQIYLSDRQCVPDNSLYMADVGNGTDITALRTEIEAWFANQIDTLCGI